MFDTLVFYDEDGAWVPSMAESWEVQEDGSVLQFTLRPGMTFHDGTPCDAEAVKWTIDNLWLDPEVGLAALKDRFTGAEVVDPQTIRLLLTQPDVTSFATLADQFIVSPTAYQELGPDEFALNPVGSGPYSFESWRQGSELTQVRFDGYWDAERPYPDSLVWKPLPEDTVRMINLTEGEVDVATFIPDAEVETMQSTDGIEVGMQLGGYVGVMFNMVDPPFDKLANREALLLAIDYDALNSAVFFG
ncbi:MAG: hypothetical protein KC438_12815, partial [Thermomicrobiales bacterium]|nr:hypothetical protein [Thermomicrobiales bacterium]